MQPFGCCVSPSNLLRLKCSLCGNLLFLVAVLGEIEGTVGEMKQQNTMGEDMLLPVDQGNASMTLDWRIPCILVSILLIVVTLYAGRRHAHWIISYSLIKLVGET
jgi:hypothetical protein